MRLSETFVAVIGLTGRLEPREIIPFRLASSRAVTAITVDACRRSQSMALSQVSDCE
jgi:hypothetical protein